MHEGSHWGCRTKGGIFWWALVVHVWVRRTLIFFVDVVLRAEGAKQVFAHLFAHLLCAGVITHLRLKYCL